MLCGERIRQARLIKYIHVSQVKAVRQAGQGTAMIDYGR